MIRQHRRRHLGHFRSCQRVLDVGCGEGIFLELLRAEGIASEGVESDLGAARAAREKGLACSEGDAVEFLSRRDGQYNGIACFHVIEHLGPDQAEHLIRGSFKALAKGGLLVVLTPNPRNINVITADFWDDPTHVRPYGAGALREMLLKAGYASVDIGEDRAAALDGLPTWKRIAARSLGALGKILVGSSGHEGDLVAVARKAS